MVKIYVDFGNKIWDNKVPTNLSKTAQGKFKEKQISSTNRNLLRNNLIEIDFENSTATAALKFKKTKFAERKEQEGILKVEAEEIQNFGKAVLGFFLGRLFQLTTDQSVKLQNMQAYFQATGKFPPLTAMEQYDSELYNMVAQAIEDGELPPLPASMEAEKAAS